MVLERVPTTFGPRSAPKSHIAIRYQFSLRTRVSQGIPQWESLASFDRKHRRRCCGGAVTIAAATAENQRKTKGQQLKGKIVLALVHTFPHFSTLFQNFSPRTFLIIKAFLKDNKKKKTKPFCTFVVARLSSSKKIARFWCTHLEDRNLLNLRSLDS